jgi:hypothetical protein
MDFSLRKEAGSFYITFGSFRLAYNMFLIFIIGDMNVEKKSNDNFKTTIASKNYDRPKTTGECGIF